MKKIAGYVIVPVALGLLLLVGANGCSKAKAPTPKASPAKVARELPFKTYAEMLKLATTYRAKMMSEGTTGPGGQAMTAQIIYTWLNAFRLKDTGTVVRTAEIGNNGQVYLDMDGDGQPDVMLAFGGKPVPSDIKAGDKLDVTCGVSDAAMSGNHLTMTGVNPTYKVVSSGDSGS